MHIIIGININKAMEFAKSKTILCQEKQLVNYYLVLLSTSFGSPHMCLSLSSTTGIGLSVNNFLTGSSISPFPETARLVLSDLQ